MNQVPRTLVVRGSVYYFLNFSPAFVCFLINRLRIKPKGNWINETQGIVPDEEVELSEKYFETLLDKDDTQLNYAIEYLTKRK